MNKVKLIEVRSEIAAGTRGASLGIEALKVASLDRDSQYFGTFDSVNVDDENNLLFLKNNYPHAKHIDGVHTMVRRVCSTVNDVMNEKRFPIVLAGDHSTAAGTICGIKKNRPDQRLGVIWIDAHADLHSPYTTPSGNMHGMPLAMVTGLDNKEMQVNDITEGTREIWEDIKNVGVKGPKIDPGDIVFISVRDTEDPEKHLMEKHGIKNFTPEEISRKGIKQVAKEATEMLSHCENIYVSFDVDSIDSRISKGTGTPVPGGLSVEEAKLLNEEIIKEKKVCCWEIVEVNPTLDTENLMAENAFDILENTTKSLIENF
ncbi:arginase [Mangrovivirga cuniculi]|uniref:Arginase n=1 Tax=Mangrovivirga cuniculi TaxID=2715131 RepID=A0A4D7K5P3_9BACT|nr:arginase [Mangrovivirga cuniculi]QCK14698.1 arginase [Mangrovivirga cuniculi]